MSVRLFRVIAPVTDIDQAARFYSRLLGFEGIRVSSGRHYFECEGTILACLDPPAEGDGEPLPPNPEYIYFSVEDLEATRLAAVDAGAVFRDGEVHGDPMSEIHRRPWGEVSFYAEDPFGNKLGFVDQATVFTGG